MKNPDVEAIPSSFGGGWVCPFTDKGEQALKEFFGEEATELRPLCDRIGYIVEPYQTADLAAYLREAGATWEIG